MSSPPLLFYVYPLSPRVLSFKSELAHPLVPTCLLFFNRAHPPSIELLAEDVLFSLSFRLNYFPSLRSFRFNAGIVINRFERKRKRKTRSRSIRKRSFSFIFKTRKFNRYPRGDESFGWIYIQSGGRTCPKMS